MDQHATPHDEEDCEHERQAQLSDQEQRSHTNVQVSSMEQALMQMGHPSSSFQLQQPIEATSQSLADTQPGPSQQVALFLQSYISA